MQSVSQVSNIPNGDTTVTVLLSIDEEPLLKTDVNQPLLAQEYPTLPAKKLSASLGCNLRTLTDIKQWYIGIITPNFSTIEARKSLGFQTPDRKMFPHSPSPSETPPVSPPPDARTQGLIDARGMFRVSSKEFNAADTASAEQKIEPPPSFTTRWFSPLTPGSVRSCSVTLSATALGAGALAVPYAFSLVGLGLGLLTLTLAALVSALSLQVLIVAARYTNSKSYASIMQLAVGSRFAPAILDLTVVLNGVGAIICILIFEGDFLPSVLPATLVPGREIAVIGAAVAVWPLTLPAELSALRYVAVLVPTVLLITVLLVVWDAPACHRAMREAGGRIVWWDFDLKRWLQASSIMVNAFMNQSNAVPAGNQLHQPSIARIVKATVNGSLMNWGLYATMGIAGYVSWGKATQGDFIMNYPQGNTEIWLCRVWLSLIVYLVLPVALSPTSKSFAQLVLMISGADSNKVSRPLHRFSATLLLVCCTVVAVAISNVAFVVGLLGGLIATSLMFWFPAVILYNFLWPVMPRLFRLPILLAMIVFGVAGWASVCANYIV